MVQSTLGSCGVCCDDPLILPVCQWITMDYLVHCRDRWHEYTGTRMGTLIGGRTGDKSHFPPPRSCEISPTRSKNKAVKSWKMKLDRKKPSYIGDHSVKLSEVIHVLVFVSRAVAPTAPLHFPGLPDRESELAGKGWGLSPSQLSRSESTCPDHVSLVWYHPNLLCFLLPPWYDRRCQPFFFFF